MLRYLAYKNRNKPLSSLKTQWVRRANRCILRRREARVPSRCKNSRAVFLKQLCPYHWYLVIVKTPIPLSLGSKMSNTMQQTAAESSAQWTQSSMHFLQFPSSAPKGARTQGYLDGMSRCPSLRNIGYGKHCWGVIYDTTLQDFLSLTMMHVCMRTHCTCTHK